MKIQIRQGVFETNSSSCHSLTVCDLKQFELWDNGCCLFNEYKQDFIDIRGISKEDVSNLKKKRKLLTLDEYMDKYEKTFCCETRYKGNEIEVCFGHTGYDDF